MMNPSSEALRIERLPGNPIIRPAMLPAHDGANINGPSLIRAPTWITNPLGNYYLYFACSSCRNVHSAGLCRRTHWPVDGVSAGHAAA